MAGIMTSNPTDFTAQINSIYRSKFGRDAEKSGLDYWNGVANQHGVANLAAWIGGGAQTQDSTAMADITATNSDADPTNDINTGQTWSGNLSDVNSYKWNAAENRWENPVAAPAATAATPAPAVTATTAQPPAAAPAPLAKSGAQGYQPEKWAINPATDTVEGRLKGLMASSPLKDQVTADVMKAANAKGLMNSSLAVTAAEDALMRSSLPIAAQDASTYASAGQFNAGQENAAKAFTAGAANTKALQEMQSQLQLKLQEIQSNTQLSIEDKRIASQKLMADNDNALRLQIAKLQSDTSMSQQEKQSATQMAVAQLNASTQTQIANLETQAKTQFQQMEIQNKNLLQASSAASAYFNQAVTAITNFQTNSNMDAAAKTTAIDNIIEQTKAGLADQSAIIGVNIGQNFSTLVTNPVPSAPAQTGNQFVFGGAESLA